MPSTSSLLLTLLLTLLTLHLTSAGPLSSPKRGLVHVPSNDHPKDDLIWSDPPSDLTWYYNYGASPSSVFTPTSLEFVPMLWGAPETNPSTDTSFLTTIQSLLSSGTNISHVLAFNEPDGPAAYGGSNISPALAAQIWLNNIAPLRNSSSSSSSSSSNTSGIKLGLPAVTGSPSGKLWLDQFLGNCSSLNTPRGQNCTYDFVPLHWYGNFEGLASHIGTYRAAYPNASLWVTEYALDHASLADSQSFYNTSAEYLDRLEYVERYSYFGSFRSDVSNVGPNAAMLSGDGRLTDIGAWYLGESATGVVPTSDSVAGRGWSRSGIGCVLAVLVAVGSW